jgi:hypothetical protein
VDSAWLLMWVGRMGTGSGRKLSTVTITSYGEQVIEIYLFNLM